MNDEARWPRRIQVVSVVSVALVAAIGSYAHMYELARSVGEGWRAYLLPISVDGLVVAASMTMYVRGRQGRKIGFLAPAAFLVGLGASVAANIASAKPTIEGQAVAAFAPVALMIAYELLLALARPDSPPVADAEQGPSLQAQIATVQAAQVPGAERDLPALELGNLPPDPKPQPRNLESPVRPAAPVDVADLLPEARDIAGRLGRVPGWKVMAKEIRDRDLPCGTPKAQALVAALKAEQNGSGE